MFNIRFHAGPRRENQAFSPRIVPNDARPARVGVVDIERGDGFVSAQRKPRREFRGGIPQGPGGPRAPPTKLRRRDFPSRTRYYPRPILLPRALRSSRLEEL